MKAAVLSRDLITTGATKKDRDFRGVGSEVNNVMLPEEV
jgi:hypothetical protein